MASIGNPELTYRCLFDKVLLEPTNAGTGFDCPYCAAYYCKVSDTSAAIVRNGSVLGYYPFPWVPTPATPAAAADPAVPTSPPTNTVELLKQHEATIEKILDAMPEVQKYILYKYLYINGIRIGDCAPKTEKLLREEMKALKAAGTP